MEWLVFVLALELGWQPEAYFASYSPPVAVVGDGQFYQTFEAKAVLFGFLELGGSVRVQDWLTADRFPPNFWLNQIDSIFFVDVRLGPLTVGWRHECIHPVSPWQPAYGIKPSWDGAGDEVYARVELKLGG